MKEAMRAVLPPFLQPIGLQAAGKLPSAAHLHRMEFAFDLSLMLLSERKFPTPSVKFEWSDSSPVKGEDWLWSQYNEVAIESLDKVFSAIVNLTHALDNFSYSWRQEHDDDVPMDFTPDLLWHPWLKTLKAEIQRHVNPPMAMGDGCKSLADKCAVEAHKWYLQKPLEEPLIEEARRYACHCGDVGTEIGTPDFQLEVHEELLPEWVSRPASRGPDVNLPNEDFESDDFPLDADGPVFDAGGDRIHMVGDQQNMYDMLCPKKDPDSMEDGLIYMMPNAVPIAGLQHICDNLFRETHEGLEYWPEFFADLKIMEAFLRFSNRRRKFVNTCLRNTRLERLEHLFENFSASLYEPRWREVLGFLQAVYPLIPALCLGFYADKYNSYVDTNDETAREEDKPGYLQFDPHALEKALRGTLFTKYMSMAMKVEKVPPALALRCEQCPCHAYYCKDLSGYMCDKAFTCHYGCECWFCPAAGCNAPEVAGGLLEETFEVLRCSGERDLYEEGVQPNTAPLTAEDWKIILDDFSKAVSSVLLLLQLKTGFWRALPYLFAVLVHVLEETARAAGRKILALWKAKPSQGIASLDDLEVVAAWRLVWGGVNQIC